MNMIDEFFNLFVVHYVYQLIVYFVTSKAFRLKIESKKAFSLSLLFSIYSSLNFAVSVIVIGGGIIPETSEILLVNNIFLFLEQLLMIIFLMLAFEIPFYKIYWFTFVLQAVIALPIQLIYLSDFTYKNSDSNFELYPMTPKLFLQYITILAFMVALGYIVLTITKLLKRIKKVFHIPKWGWMIINMALVIQLYFAQRNFTGDVTVERVKNAADTEQVLMTSIIVVILLYISNNYADNKLLKVENNLLMKQSELQYANYLAMQQQELQIHKLYHDIGNHIKTIKILVDNGETKEAKAYTENLEQEYREIRKDFYTNNKIINAVLSQKLKLCEESGISCQLDINIKDQLPIRDIDLMCIYSNLLDNAIEACQRNVNTTKYIQIKSSIIGNYLAVKILNSKPVEGKSMKEKSKAFTWKKDKTLHGYGLRILEEIVERYEGQKELLNLGEVYSSMVMLKLPV